MPPKLLPVLVPSWRYGQPTLTLEPTPSNELRRAVAERQDVEHRRPDAAVPAAGQGQFGGHRSLRENLLSRASRRA